MAWLDVATPPAPTLIAPVAARLIAANGVPSFASNIQTHGAAQPAQGLHDALAEKFAAAGIPVAVLE